MFGYMQWKPEGRPRIDLKPEMIGGATFLTLEVQGGSRRLRRRVSRAVADMERAGIRRCVMPPKWPEEWRGGMLPVEEQGLRQTVFPQLLDRYCQERGLDLRDAAVLLSAPAADRQVWTTADLLARRSRYLILSVADGEELRRELLRRYGIAAVTGGRRPALQVCFDRPRESVPALLLGPDCTRRQNVIYELPPSLLTRLGEREPSSQLVSALWESGALPAEDIRVKSLGFPA